VPGGTLGLDGGKQLVVGSKLPPGELGIRHGIAGMVWQYLWIHSALFCSGEGGAFPGDPCMLDHMEGKERQVFEGIERQAGSMMTRSSLKRGSGHRLVIRV
jgi:hypothetical protein